MNKIQTIVNQTRRTGNTTWIIKSAIKNPNCVIVSKNKRESKLLKQKYIRMLSNDSLFQKLKWEIFGRKQPIFLTINDSYRGFNLPIIFDNNALL